MLKELAPVAMQVRPRVCRCDSRRWFVGSAVRFVFQVPLGLRQGGLDESLLGHVQLRVLLDVLPHSPLEHHEPKTEAVNIAGPSEMLP